MGKDLRNNFTDALNEEITSRKIFDKTKTSDEKNIFLSEIENKIDTASETKNTEVNEADFDPKNFVEKKPPMVIRRKLEAKDDFEKRVFAEAENDFYDEKISDIGEHLRSKSEDKNNFVPTFHSRTFKNEPQESTEENLTPDPELYRKLSRAEIAGVTLSLFMLVYGFANLDKPLVFVSISLLSHLLRPFIGAFFGKYNRDVQNALRSFSIVLFLGALLFIFI
ncbi:MAG: hypothetical protein IK062_07570 [Selenomonadaceae bacterium]|nr:hypothetical protein [Selenomonadaceae bacterium]